MARAISTLATEAVVSGDPGCGKVLMALRCILQTARRVGVPAFCTTVISGGAANTGMVRELSREIALIMGDSGLLDELQTDSTCKCLKASLGDLDHRRGGELNPRRLPRELFAGEDGKAEEVDPDEGPQRPPAIDDGIRLSPDLLRSPKGKPPATPDVSLPPGFMAVTPLERLDARLREDPECASLAPPASPSASKLRGARYLGRWINKLAAREKWGRHIQAWRAAIR